MPMVISRKLLLAITAMLIVVGGIYLGTRLALPQPTSPRSTVPWALDEAADKGYAWARTPRAFSFPADHGPHPTFRTEWWYFTGNLTDPQERPFGFELTFFRIALSPTRAASESAWRTQQLYMAHFALTDVAAKQFHAYERFSRDWPAPKPIRCMSGSRTGPLNRKTLQASPCGFGRPRTTSPSISR